MLNINENSNNQLIQLVWYIFKTNEKQKESTCKIVEL